MPKRRHPNRIIYLYSVLSPWWTNLSQDLELKTGQQNSTRQAVSQEHWFVRVGPQVPTLRRQIRSQNAVICLAPERWTPELEKAIASRPIPVFLIAAHLSQEQRLRAETLGWKVWLTTQSRPGQLVSAVLDYCYS